MVTSRLLPEPEKQAIGSRASFSQPMGICVENNKTILITDAQLGTIKLITEINDVNLFLENLGKLYEAFSVHLKHKWVNTSLLPEVCLLLHLAIVVLPSAILEDRLERSSSHGAFEKSIDESRGQGIDEEMGKRSWKMC